MCFWGGGGIEGSAQEQQNMFKYNSRRFTIHVVNEVKVLPLYTAHFYIIILSTQLHRALCYFCYYVRLFNKAWQ